MKISIDRTIGDPGHGKDVVNGLNERDKRCCGGWMNRLSKNISTAWYGLGMRYPSLIRSVVSFTDQCKVILTEVLRIAGKIGHSKIKNRVKYKVSVKALYGSKIRINKAYRIQSII